jgi:hypothetical protein
LLDFRIMRGGAMKERDKPKEPNQHWPFDPMQPGDHEPVTIPEDHWPEAPDLEEQTEKKKRAPR